MTLNLCWPGLGLIGKVKFSTPHLIGLQLHLVAGEEEEEEDEEEGGTCTVNTYVCSGKLPLSHLDKQRKASNINWFVFAPELVSKRGGKNNDRALVVLVRHVEHSGENVNREHSQPPVIQVEEKLMGKVGQNHTQQRIDETIKNHRMHLGLSEWVAGPGRSLHDLCSLGLMEGIENIQQLVGCLSFYKQQTTKRVSIWATLKHTAWTEWSGRLK